MTHPDIAVVSILRALVEVAGLALLGQGVLAVLAGRRRSENVVYQLLQVVTGPVVRAARFLTPRFIVDAHVPLLAFFALFWLWIALAAAKRYLCAAHGLPCFA
jgi:hypothetical protein